MDVNGKLATQTIKYEDILHTIGNFPAHPVHVSGPATANVADELELIPGDAVKLDKTTGKLARYVAGDTEDIYGIVFEPYSGKALKNALMPAGSVNLYWAGHIMANKCFRSKVDGSREPLSPADCFKARKVQLVIY